MSTECQEVCSDFKEKAQRLYSPLKSREGQRFVEKLEIMEVE